MKNLFLFIICIISFTSCQRMIVKAMFKNPKVENTASIRAFQEKNNYSTYNSLIIMADSSEVSQKLFKGMTSGYMVFNDKGQLMRYKGKATCSGIQYRELLDSSASNFMIVENDSISLEKVLAETYTLEEQSVNLKDLKSADYYVVAYWAKFLGKKRGYEDMVNWMEKEAQKTNKKSTIEFIKINTDLQERWGMIPGEKAKIKTKMTNKSLSISIEKIPFAKS